MIVNKFAKKCQSCNKMVNAGEGFCYKNGFKWLTTCASTACITRLGLQLPGPQGDKARKLNLDGSIQMPFDREALVFLRAMPGARWNPETKAWSVNLSPEHLPRVLELADKLQLEVPTELREKVKEGTTDSKEAKERASDERLYEYQRAGVEFLALHNKALLSDDQGLGKSCQALLALPKDAQVIIISPTAVKYNWKTEVEKWRPEFKVSIMVGRNAFKVPEPGEIVVTNYDILPEFLTPKPTGDKNWKGKTIKKASIPAEVANKLKNVTVIADEVQAFKNFKAARSQKVTELCKLVERTWFLSGTPYSNKPFDLWGVLSAGNMAQAVFGSFNKFLQLFGAQKDMWGGYTFSTPSPEVTERLKRVMIRRLKKDVLKDLPAKRYQTITVNGIDKTLQEELDEAWNDLEEWQDEVGSSDELPPFDRFSKIRAKLAESKIPAAEEICASFEDSDEPLLVFSCHVKPVKAIGSREGWRIIIGDTPSKERQEIVQEFQSGKLRGVACTIQAAGVGLTLTRASNALFIDRMWNPSDNIQAEDRLHRISQTNPVLIKDLIVNHKLEAHVHRLLQHKAMMITAAMDGQLKFKAPKSYEQPELVQETEEQMIERINQAAKEVEQQEAKRKVAAILGREIAKSEIPEPKLTPKRKQMIREALEYMASRCDGAISKDGQGFAKNDAHVAHWIYATGMKQDDDITYRVLERILSRYHRQLKHYEAIWRPDL